MAEPLKPPVCVAPTTDPRDATLTVEVRYMATTGPAIPRCTWVHLTGLDTEDAKIEAWRQLSADPNCAEVTSICITDWDWYERQ